MSKQFYEVEVERIAIIKGKVLVKARGAGKAMELAQRALDDNDGRIEWAAGTTNSRHVAGVLGRQRVLQCKGGHVLDVISVAKCQ